MLNTSLNIRGIVPPIVTPFTPAGELDEPLLRQEVRFLVNEAGVHGLTVCGSTGEGHTLSTAECCRVLACAMEETRGRVPVIAGVIANSTAAAVERARALAQLRPAALQVTPVHYLFRPDDDAMVRHFAEIAQRAAVPLLVYNVVPWSYLSTSLLMRILEEVDGVAGVKQSANDMRALADLLLLIEEAGIAGRVRIVTAVDALLYPSFVLGAHAAIAAILAAVPEWCVALWNAVEAGDREQALALHRQLLRLWRALEAPNLPANVRTVMKYRNRDGGCPRPPMTASSPGQEQRIREALDGCAVPIHA